MTHQEKEALLKRIYALPTEWADAGGSYGKGGPAGSDDAAMLWPEAVIDAINQFAGDNNSPDKQPDPITGLVPCGCGGNAEVGDGNKAFCGRCGITTLEQFTQEDAKGEWNRAMGVKGADTDACDRLRWLLTQAERVVRVEDADRAAVDRACRLMADIDNGFDRART